jgi:hypothetical protein
MAPQASATPPGLDPQIVNLARAIRQTESQGNFQAVGKSGEYGAYQFLPSTWDANAPKYGVNVPLNQATPEQQNEVAYKQLAEWKQQHPDWNVGNFASAWNAGPGKPNAYIENNVGTNSQGVAYDTPGYALKVASAYQQFKAQSPDTSVPTYTAVSTPDAPPSLGGFAQNVVKSGAQLLGNVGEAALHPIQTVQSIGGAAVGGLQELGGQQNDNTAKFDGLVNYFKQRYGSVSQLEHTAYTDPVGLAADISSALGIGGGIAGVAGKGAELAKAGGIADALGGVSGALGKASELTNPLTPVIAGGSALIGDGAKLTSGVGAAFTGIPAHSLEDIYKDPAAYTPEEIANTSRITVAKQVEGALQGKISALEDTSSSYAPVLKQETPIPVKNNFLEDQFRKAGLDVQDGVIRPTTVSKLTKSDLPKLQDILDTYKPAFQKGELTPQEFITLRQKFDDAAYGDLGIKNTKVAGVASQIRGSLNTAYRDHVPGLESLDNTYSSQIEELSRLKKGFIDKDGNLLDSAINKIANATGKGKDPQLARLEEIVPGITRKLEVMKTIEDIQKASANHGGFLGKIAEGGSLLAGITSGNMPLVGGAIAAIIVSSPQVAVPLLRTLGANRALVSIVVAHLSKYATLGAVANSALSGQDQSAPQGALDQISSDQTQTPTSSQGTSISSGTYQVNASPSVSQVSPGSLDSLAKAHNFDLEAARQAGYTDQEIQDFLSSSQAQ